MSTELIPFSNDEFALDLIPDGDTFNVAAPGLARALGFAEAAIMTRNMPDTEKGSVLVQTPGGEQKVLSVTEAGFYRAIGQRQVARITDPEIRAKVERFQSWVYATVLPEIRRTGGYQSAPALDPATISRRDLALMIVDAEDRADRAEEQARVLAPKAEYVDTYVADDDYLSFSTVASTLDMKERDLRELLIAKGWIYRETMRRWSNKKERVVPVNRYTEYAHKKPYFYRREDHDAPRFRGEVMHTLKITAPGAQAVARLVRRGEDGPELEVVS